MSRPASMSFAQARTIARTARRRSGTGWTRPLRAYQATAASSVPVAELGERGAFGRVDLAEVVAEREDVVGVALGEGA